MATSLVSLVSLQPRIGPSLSLDARYQIINQKSENSRRPGIRETRIAADFHGYEMVECYQLRKMQGM